MRGKLLRTKGKIEEGATVEIVSMAKGSADPAPGSSPRSRSPKYVVQDDEGHKKTVASKDFQIER
jgi:hypothetical protein